MKKIYSLDKLRQIELTAEAAGIDLMQRAARAAADWIASRYPLPSQVLVAVGTGNNGGDALWVALNLFSRGFDVMLFIPQLVKSQSNQYAYQLCRQDGIPEITDLKLLSHRPDVLIDGLFGIGLNRELSEPWQQIIDHLNALKLPVLSLDTPSGLDAYRGVTYGRTIKATATLTFLCAKPGLHTADGVEYSGLVYTDGLDLPRAMAPLPDGTLKTVSADALRRHANSNKGSYGTVCVIGGAQGMNGAAILCGRAALGAGAGKVYAAMPQPPAIDSCAPELMLTDFVGAREKKCDVYAIGPGLSCSAQAREILTELLALPTAKVLDADALNLMAVRQLTADDICHDGECIITPHPAEAARLLGSDIQSVQNDRVLAAQQLSQKFNCIAVLKGCGTIIACPDGFYRVNTTGNPALSVAGQGDVLTGVCAALLAQGMNAFDAASLAVEVHGQAGDAYTDLHGVIGLSASATIALIAGRLNKKLQE